MSSAITPDELAASLADAFREYSEELTDEVFAGVEQIGKETVKEVRDKSPVYTGDSAAYKENHKPGTYKKSWTYHIDKERGSINVTVHSRKYQLVHLLENGHLTRNGTSRARAIPHVEPANENAQRKVDELLRRLK